MGLSRLASRGFGRLVTATTLAVGLFIWPQPVAAHDGMPPAPHDLWQQWEIEWPLAVAVLVGLLLYGKGVFSVWRQSSVGRGIGWGALCAFAGGVVSLVVALLSPLDTLSSALFSAHMAQHVLLIHVAAPLLILGIPPALPFWILPRGWRRPLSHWLHNTPAIQWLMHWSQQPIFAWLCYGAALWVWHAPLLYEAALRDDRLHHVEHLLFLGTALLFWWLVIRQAQSRLRTEVALLFVFSTALHSGLLGALLTFATRPLYRHYITTAPLWGISALTDQQLAGTIMWVPVGFVYLLTMILLLQRWLTLSPQPAGETEELRVHSLSTNALRPPDRGGQVEATGSLAHNQIYK